MANHNFNGYWPNGVGKIWMVSYMMIFFPGKNYIQKNKNKVELAYL